MNPYRFLAQRREAEVRAIAALQQKVDQKVRSWSTEQEVAEARMALDCLGAVLEAFDLANDDSRAAIGELRIHCLPREIPEPLEPRVEVRDPKRVRIGVATDIGQHLVYVQINPGQSECFCLYTGQPMTQWGSRLSLRIGQESLQQLQHLSNVDA